MDTEQKCVILAKAEELFMRLGIKSISMDDLSRQLGMSKKTLYQSFRSKGVLIREVIAGACEREQEVISGIQSKNYNAVEEFILIAHFVINQLRNLSPSTLYDLQKYYPKAWNHFETEHRHFVIESMERNIVRGIEQGLYRPEINAQMVAHFYFSMTRMLVNNDFNLNHKYSQERLFLNMMDYHLAGLTTSEGRAVLTEKKLIERLSNPEDHFNEL